MDAGLRTAEFDTGNSPETFILDLEALIDMTVSRTSTGR